MTRFDPGSQTYTLEPQSFDEMIALFWQEWEAKEYHVQQDGFCQCETDRYIYQPTMKPILINGKYEYFTKYAEFRMHSFLMVSVFIDSFFQTHLSTYSSFREKFKIPRLHNHPFPGHFPAGWFCYAPRRYVTKIDWEDVEKVASIAINDIKKSDKNIEDAFVRTKEFLPFAIEMEFNSNGEITECGELFKNILIKYW